MELTRPEQDPQIHCPHKRQWCLRWCHWKLQPHLIQELVFWSNIQIAGTQCSTLRLLFAEWPRFSFSFFLPFPLGLNCFRDSTPETSSRPQEQNQQPQDRRVQHVSYRQIYCHSKHVPSPYSAEVQHENTISNCAYPTFAVKLGVILQRDSSHRMSTTRSQLISCFWYVSYR